MIRKTSYLPAALLLSSLLLLPSSSFAVRHNGQPKFLPPEDKVLFMVGQDRKAIENYIRKVGIVPAGFTFYTSIQNMDGWEKRADYGGGEQHAAYLLNRY